MAYPQADQAMQETIGINAFMNALLRPTIDIRLYVIRGQPKTLQEAVAYAMEVDAVLESAAPKAPQRKAHVQQVEGETSKDDYMTSGTKRIVSMTAAFKALENRLQELESNLKRKSTKGKCFNSGKLGHFKKECRAPKKLGNREGCQDPP